MKLLLLPQLILSKTLPVVLWHGMGDTCCQGLLSFADQIKAAVPSIPYVRSVRIGPDEQSDRNSGFDFFLDRFFDIINRQVQEACDEFKNDPNLKDGFNAIGFSQGGLILRAYVEQCNDPPVKTLITFGSPHAGVTDLPNCVTPSWSCTLMRSIARNGNVAANSGVYLGWVQRKIVQAQYFKDAKNIAGYLKNNIFLPFVNGEVEHANLSLYRSNLMSLEKFVMIQFSEDQMVVPKTSAHFGFVDANGTNVALRESEIYLKDNIGLQTLDKQDKLVFLELEGPHLYIDIDSVNEIAQEYLDGESHSFLIQKTSLTNFFRKVKSWLRA